MLEVRWTQALAELEAQVADPLQVQTLGTPKRVIVRVSAHERVRLSADSLRVGH